SIRRHAHVSSSRFPHRQPREVSLTGSRSATEAPYVRDSDYPRRYRDERFDSGTGRRTHAREVRALRRLLARAPAVEGPWLDVPCGAGRLSELLPGPV